MIVKRLRQQKAWSQEQLATFCGVSLRTIQRVEAGNKASIETLKALASVFEVELSKLTEEIIVIDKSTKSWKAEPFLVRMGFLGIKKRSHMMFIEYLLIVGGLLIWYYDPADWATPLPFIGAYLNARMVAYIDKKGYW